jgi:UTP-glucose-1-phosphate uridylyltransferase
MQKTLVVLAAGIGSRYGGFKQMDPIGPSGEFIIDYSVYDAIRAGFQRVVFIIRHDIEQAFKTTIGARVAGSIEVGYTFQELKDLPEGIVANPDRTKPWGTVQAVLTCAPVVDSPFAVINADDFYGGESYRVLSQFLDGAGRKQNEYAMVGFRLSNTLSEHGSVTRGLCRSTPNQRLEGIVETSGIVCEDHQIYFTDATGNKNSLSPDQLVSMNMWGFTPSIFAFFAEEFQAFLRSHAQELKSELVLPTAVGSLIARKKASVRVLSTSSKWFGITHPNDKEGVIGRIRQLIAQGEYPDNLWKK